MISLGAPVPDPEVYDGKGSAPLPVFFQGPTLLLFIAAGSERCRKMVPLVARWRTLGTNVVGVSQETIEDTAEFLKEIGSSIPVVIDDRPYPASRAFEIEQVPALAMIINDHVEWVSDGCPPGDLVEIHRLLEISKPLPTEDLGAASPSKHI